MVEFPLVKVELDKSILVFEFFDVFEDFLLDKLAVLLDPNFDFKMSKYSF